MIVWVLMGLHDMWTTRHVTGRVIADGKIMVQVGRVIVKRYF
ncbi:MAG: hypothetical protein ACOC1N_00180 [Bacillota bacterium]